jgi:site-specific DNA-methyltransferase (adenine-specific)
MAVPETQSGGSPAQTAAVVLEGSAESRVGGLADGLVQATITSPPYYRQKDYHTAGQWGWESSVGEYVAKISALFEQLWRVTRPSGTCFFVVGDSYVNKALQLVPQRLAIAAADVGWTIRNDLIWAKTDAAPDEHRKRDRFAYERRWRGQVLSSAASGGTRPGVSRPARRARRVTCGSR